MKPVQLKMARTAVGWGVRELAAAAGVTANTITRIEKGNDAKSSTLDALQKALENEGVVFTQEDGMIGVKLSTKGVTSKGHPVDKTVTIEMPDQEDK